MSLFASSRKWERESKESISIKQRLIDHTATYPEARRLFEAGRPAVIELTSELNNILQGEGRSETWKKKALELREATRARDKPLHEYSVVKADLERELSSLSHYFITEQLEEWVEEEKKISSQIEHTELPKEKEEPGVFSIGGSHRMLSNRKAISLFREKSLESRNRLRDMIHFSIPEILGFIEKAKAELREIRLAPEVIELGEIDFQRDRRDSAKESGRMAAGVLTAASGIEIKSPGINASDSRYDSVKAKAAQGMYDAAKEMVSIAKNIK